MGAGRERAREMGGIGQIFMVSSALDRVRSSKQWALCCVLFQRALISNTSYKRCISSHFAFIAPSASALFKFHWNSITRRADVCIYADHRIMAPLGCRREFWCPFRVGRDQDRMELFVQLIGLRLQLVGERSSVKSPSSPCYNHFTFPSCSQFF